MGLFSSGSKSARKTKAKIMAEAKRAKDASQAALTEGRDLGVGAINTGVQQAGDAYGLGNQQAIQALQQGGQAALGRLDPIAQYGYGAMDRINQGSTAQGFASNIEDLRTGGSLNPLIAENRRNLEAELSAQGLGRSGYGITEMSQLPIETIMGIENQLQGRNMGLAGLSMPAINAQAQTDYNMGAGVSGLESQYGQTMGNLYGNQGSSLADLYNQYGQGVSGLEQNLGQMNIGALQGYQQAKAAGQSNLLGTLGTVAGLAAAPFTGGLSMALPALMGGGTSPVNLNPSAGAAPGTYTGINY